jgi:hypothetical protein
MLTMRLVRDREIGTVEVVVHQEEMIIIHEFLSVIRKDRIKEV